MIPPLIVQEALDRGIDLIAITDHNASANIAAVQKAAFGTHLTVLPGMEVQTREEVHSLCLFETLEQIIAFQNWVDAALPAISNRPDYFGEQFVVDDTGDFLRREERLLLVSADYSIEDAAAKVHALGGIFIPAHINRTSFGLIPVLGLVPPGLEADALEISRHITPQQAASQYPYITRYPMIQSGDVHRLDEFLGINQLTLEKPCISELRLALANREGRQHQILSLS